MVSLHEASGGCHICVHVLAPVSPLPIGVALISHMVISQSAWSWLMFGTLKVKKKKKNDRLKTAVLCIWMF